MAQSLTRGRTSVAPKPETKGMGRTRQAAHWGAWLYLVLVAGLLALAAVGAVAAYQYRYAGRIYPGVRVAGIPLDGMTLSEAEDAIRQGLTPYPGLPIVLQYEGRSWALTPSELGVAVDAAATASQAYSVGRTGEQASLAGLPGGTSHEGTTQGAGPAATAARWQAYLASQWNNLTADLAEQWDVFWRGIAIGPTVVFSDGQVNYHLLRIAREIDQAPQEGSLTVSGLDVIATPGRPGRQVNLEATRTALLATARSGQGGAVPLVVTDRQPAISSVEQAANQARTLLSRPLTLIAKGADASQRFAVDRATLRQWLSIAPIGRPAGTVELQVQVKADLVTAYLKQIAGQFNRSVQDATLDFNPETRQVKVLTPSQPGQELDVAGSVAAIEAALAGDQREINLPVTVRQPKIDAGKVAEMGIQELVVEASTGFAGSSSGRVHNIINAASKFNNVVIAPDEVFSFNRYVGDVTTANGFVDSLIISGDRTEVGVGGGVCQVSTTAFQTAARGGFPIVQRWPHSYIVSYYGKPGLDATIYTPDVDFQFKNDTGHYILIKTEVNTGKSTVTFRFYGTKPNRSVEIGEPKITNITPAPKALYKEDKSLPAGVIKQVDYANNGSDVVVERTIRNGDGTVKTERFTSKYQAWRAIFLYGPGTQLPPGALDSPADSNG